MAYKKRELKVDVGECGEERSDNTLIEAPRHLTGCAKSWWKQALNLDDSAERLFGRICGSILASRRSARALRGNEDYCLARASAVTPGAPRGAPHWASGADRSARRALILHRVSAVVLE